MIYTAKWRHYTIPLAEMEQGLSVVLTISGLRDNGIVLYLSIFVPEQRTV